MEQAVTVDGNTETWLYHDGIEYRDNQLQSIYHEMGRVVYNEPLSGGPTTYPEWFLKDHLGNTRARIVDKNENGEVDVSEDPEIHEITGSYHYYPFGMEFEGVFNPQQVHVNRYKYNGKEFSKEAGWYFYGARFYDPVIGRWSSVDPLADEMSSWSTYNYTFNNPIRFTDPDGAAPETVKPGSVAALRAIKNTLSPADAAYVKLHRNGNISRNILSLNTLSQSGNFAALKQLVKDDRVLKLML